MKLGRFGDKDPEAEAKAAAQEEQEREEVQAIPIGARCEVTVPGTMPKRGTVMFVGMYVWFVGTYCYWATILVWTWNLWHLDYPPTPQ